MKKGNWEGERAIIKSKEVRNETIRATGTKPKDPNVVGVYGGFVFAVKSALLGNSSPYTLHFISGNAAGNATGNATRSISTSCFS